MRAHGPRPQGPGFPRAHGSLRAQVPKGPWVPKGQWVPKAQGSPRPTGPQGPRVPKAQGSPRPRVPKARPSPDKVLFFLGLSGAHGASWRPIGNHEGLMVGSLLNNGATIKLPWPPQGPQERLIPPPRGTKKPTKSKFSKNRVFEK